MYAFHVYIRNLKKVLVMAYQLSVTIIMPSKNQQTSVNINNKHLLLKSLDSYLCRYWLDVLSCASWLILTAFDKLAWLIQTHMVSVLLPYSRKLAWV